MTDMREALLSPEMQAVGQQAIRNHPHYDGGPVSAYGFSGAVLKAVADALTPAREETQSEGASLADLDDLDHEYRLAQESPGGVITSAELMKRAGVDLNKPFELGPFPPEERALPPEAFVECYECGGEGAIEKTDHVYEPGCGFSHPDVHSAPCQSCAGTGGSVQDAAPDAPMGSVEWYRTRGRRVTDRPSDPTPEVREDALKAVTIYIPSGYRDAAEFLNDCGFQEARSEPGRAWSADVHDDIIKRLMAQVGMPSSISLYVAFKQFANELHALTAAPAPVDVEAIAKWLHDETDHPNSYTDRTWPETDRDDGQRAGGFVKIVPLHGQEYFRNIARRLATQFSLNGPGLETREGE